MDVRRVRSARVVEEPAPGMRDGCVLDEAGVYWWLPIKCARVGDVGEIHYVTTASSGLWHWKPRGDER